ncbi:MATE family efflux transporter [Faecalibaculum rodentium]|nr:MATE family efflux transporter [Faecalibaculum rodentium]
MNESSAHPGSTMLQGPVWNRILLFALPVAATGMLEQLFNASDIAIVGSFAQTGRTEAVAAVGANSPIVGLLVNFFVGIALGANVVIAQAVGQRKPKTIEQAVQTSLLLAIACGLATTLIGEAVIGTGLSLMNIPANVYPHALQYMRIYLAGMPAILLYNFEASVFRSIGETKTPLLALAVSGVINVILNLFFVIVVHLSVAGVAIATVIANVISSLILLAILLKTDKPIRLSLHDLHPSRAVAARILRIGLPAGLQSSVFAIANIIIQTAINSLGTVVMAASSAAFNVEIFCYYVLNSFTQACTTFVSQNYGAGQFDRCRKILGVSITEGILATVLSIALVLSCGRSLLAIFNSSPQVIENGYWRMVIVFAGYVFSVLYESFSGYLRGFGISLVPALLTVLGVCGVRLVWVFAVFPQHPTFPFLMLCFPISLCVTALLMAGAVFHCRPAVREKAAAAQ